MSPGADVAVLLPAGGRRARARSETHSDAGRLAVRLTAFAALALYGTLRWGTMLSPVPTWRLLGLWAVAVALAGLGSVIGERSRWAVIALAVIAALAAFPLAGVPWHWVRHLRIAVTADGIGQGLSALPRALVPYSGINEWLRVVIVLGAAVLLLDGAVMLAFAPRHASDVRRAAAALPLLALAVVPSTLNRPALSYAHGLVLFLLIAGFVWGERIRRDDLLVAGSLALLAGAAAMIAAPGLDRHKPWLDYQALAGNLAPAHPESFDWTQRYGPLHWPHQGHPVFEVQAPHPDYWKTENLDVFDGRGWEAASLQVPDPQSFVYVPGALKQWTETLHVTLRAMRSSEIIAAGHADAPAHVGNVQPGESAGTWTVPGGLGPGDSYTVTAYDPHPSVSELQNAGTAYPNVLFPAYTSLFIPPDPVGLQPPSSALSIQPPGATTTPAVATSQNEVFFAPFGSSQPSYGFGTYGGDYKRQMRASQYARTFVLAQRLLRGAPTPYDYVMNVKGYLAHGFVYDENPPASNTPLQTFLFTTKRGYCQQFAGAMALLLRMGGIPARVATGFTGGTYDSATKSWVVSDIDAHAWVEAWFPGYGWVRFDPTPATAPARGGTPPDLPAKALGSSLGRGAAGLGGRGGPITPSTPGRKVRHAAAFPVALVVGAVLVFVLAIATLAFVVRLREPTDEERLAELERALERCGRTVTPDTTLSAIERRFRDSPDAQRYVRTLRLARFAGVPSEPDPGLRGAVRGELRAGLGTTGRLRALWAMPPRWILRREEPDPPPQGLH